MRPEQLRAARNWLNWSQADLAAASNVGLSTVKDYESGKRTPIGNNLDAMVRALREAGISFENDSVKGPFFDRRI